MKLLSREQRRASWLAHGLLLATVLIWGSTFVLVKAALADASPLLFNLLRMTLATAVLALVNRRHLRRITAAQVRLGALAGLWLAAGYQFQTLGLSHTTAAKSAFITGLVVVFVPLLTLIPALRPASQRAPGGAAIAGAALAFAGLVLLTSPAGTRLHDLASTVSAGDLLTLCCALAFAAHLLTLARAATTMPSGLLATLQIGFAAVVMLVTLPLEHPHAVASPRLLATLGVTSIFATAFAFTTQSYAQQHLPPTHTALILTLEPVFAWLTSLLFLHEALGRRGLVGAVLILAGIATTELLPGALAPEIPS